MLILGIDPGTAITGYGALESDGNHHRCLGYGAIKLPQRQPLPVKLLVLHRKLSEIMQRHTFDSMALEDLFHAVNIQSAMRLSQARGVIMLSAAQHELPVFEYSPLEVKNAVVGYGRAEKIQVQGMLCRILQLKSPPEPNDAADALAVAICHAQTHSVLARIQEARKRST